MNIVTIKELSQFLKVKESTLYSWVHNGTVPFFKLNGLLRFDLDEIKEWMEESRQMTEELSIKPIKSVDVDNIINNAIEGVKGKEYNKVSRKSDRNRGLMKMKGGIDGTI